MQNTEKMNSGAGRTPMLSPVLITNGRRYSAAAAVRRDEPLVGRDHLFAGVDEHVGRHMRHQQAAQLRCIRAAFWSGRNRLIEPSLQR